MNLEKVKGERGPYLAREDRRRSQRVLLRVKVTLHLDGEGSAETLDVHTANVSNHGALLVCPRDLPLETQFTLEYNATRERARCRVVRSHKVPQEGFHLGVEFEIPAPDFWKISFPPRDWKPLED